MIPFFGDFDATETVYIPFNTFSSDDPSASVTITDLAAADVHIHKDGSTTQRSSASGVTVSIDFDSITGNHLIAIDLSDNTDAGYYANGSRYQVRVEGTTIDGATINAWVGSFSVGCTLRPTTAGRKLDVSATGEAGLDFDNIKDATGAHALTNITVPTTTAVTNAVTISSGTGAGQLDITSGVVKSNLSQILGTALTETAGWLAAGFKKFFNVETPVMTAESVNQTGDSYAVVNSGTYGNAQLVRSTTPANTLSVDANNKVAVPDTQKVDIETVKTRAVGDVGEGNTAHLLQSADTGATAVAKTGADSDTLETLSDQLDTINDEIDKVPRKGETMRHRQVDADSDAKSADVIIEDTD